MSTEKVATGSQRTSKPVYCGVGSCDNTPGHDGMHRCRCGKPVDAPANGCGWHQAPKVPVTAPDLALTDLLAATLVRSSPNHLDQFEDLAPHRQEAWRVRARELALVVEQHTRTQTARIAALEAQLEQQKYGGRLLGDMVVKQSKDVVAAVGAEHMIDEDGDGDYGAVFELLFELRPARDAAIARAEKTEATIARVEAEAMLLERMIRTAPWSRYAEVRRTHLRTLRAALDGSGG